MSVAAIRWAFEVKCPSRTAKLILAVLAHHATDKPVAWPSFATIATQCGIARNNVPRYIHQLAEAGLIAVRRRALKGGSLANEYVLNVSADGVINVMAGCHQNDDEGVISQMTGVSSIRQQGVSSIRDPNQEVRKEVRSPPPKPNGLGAPPGGAAPAKAKKRKCGFPADWRPDERDVRFAKDRGRGEAWIALEGERCRDHHAAKGNIFADLHAAWRTWVMSAPGFERAPPPGQLSLPNGLASTGAEVWRRRLRDFAKSKFWMSAWGFPPNDPDCYAPPELLAEFGFMRAQHAVP